MDVPPQVGLGDVLGHQGQTDRLAHSPGSQVPLGGKDVRVLVGIFVDDAWVLVDQLGQALLGVSFCPPVGFVFLPLSLSSRPSSSRTISSLNCSNLNGAPSRLMNFFGALAKFRLTVSAAGFNMTINLLSLKNTLHPAPGAV